MTYKQAKDALQAMEETQQRYVIVEGKMVTRSDCFRTIKYNNEHSPEDFIEQVRRDA